MVLTYSEKTAQYSLSPPNDLRMKKAPDIRSISPTNFIPMKSAGTCKLWVYVQIVTVLCCVVALCIISRRSVSNILPLI